MQESGHDEFIKHICDMLILNKEQKTNAVWIHGAANSGKTEFLRRLANVFDCAEYQ
jgi:polynucleotide 5'-kinase involved in rRNA processing